MPAPLPDDESATPRLRSAAAARLAGMPVATLRIWEQRYRAVQPATAPSGHRLYALQDLARLQLLRALTRQGHAIGSIATLDTATLQALADAAPAARPGDDAGRDADPARPDAAADATAAAAGAGPQAHGQATAGAPAPGRRARALRLAVVGASLAARLQRPAFGHPRAAITVHASLRAAARAAAAAGPDAAPELLVWETPQLRPDAPPELAAALRAFGRGRVAALYRHGSRGATLALRALGVVVAREPGDDEALGAWLAAVAAGLGPRPAPDMSPAPEAPPLPGPADDLPPRRYDDATLTTLAVRASAVSCECPRHVAELLLQLASFEAYSAGCRHRNADDAALHAALQQVAGRARVLFEDALEQVARHEGLPLA
ncbi:MerR family transcriptional regulator [Piscinibacter sakaiensis]|uniref:HTH merR-type domain-containing protein n=1 Tax=Piscinibacter sakaiensis TaxID=1547922 RepID=A0A0K8P3W8_PISS1|nr:MerR family transcriptional regulator [Piscinibacter sakaiensis]GAP37249.1 hypothetical protein ISF6_3104 [Piscinibacter sakaiensis]